jgi:serine/threonine protein kinase
MIQDESRFIVTELMLGKSLEHLIHKKVKQTQYLHNSISFKEKITLLIDVVKGMLYLHGLQPAIVHRDLKPSVNTLFQTLTC